MEKAFAILDKTTNFVDRVYSFTEYEPDIKDEADKMFQHLGSSLKKVSQTQDGQKMMQKYSVLASTISTEGTFKDMVKIIWRMVKSIRGSAQFKMCLFFLGIGTLYTTLEEKAGDRCISNWVETIAKWLGKQLTIGGKGVTGDGEGSVNDRLQRFFSTPYLHDFD